MALPAYRRAMLDEFGDQPTPPETRLLDLPGHDAFPIGGGALTDDELYDAAHGAYDFEILDMKEETTNWLHDTYLRVAHPALDFDPDDAWLTAWRHCHNGLWKVREQLWLDGEHIHHLAERLITWSQDQKPRARLGDRGSGNWWIVPDTYHLRVGGDEESPPLGFFEDPDGESEGYEKLHDAFDKAKFTVHMVHHVNHWAVIIYQHSNGTAFYLDSMHDELEARSKLARKEFGRWMTVSGKAIPVRAQFRRIPVRDQEDRWSCGLHVVVNAMAFLRYESLGWHRIEDWTTTEARPMRRQLITCLHRLMGLKYIPGDSPTTSRQRANKKPTKRKQSTSSKASTKEPSKTAETEPTKKQSPRKASPNIAALASTRKAARRAKSISRPLFGARGAPLGRELAKSIRAEAQKDALATANRLTSLLKRQQAELREKAARRALQKRESEKRAARQAARAKERDAWVADASTIGKTPVAGRRGAISHEALPITTDLQQQPKQQQAHDATSGSPRKKRKISSAPGLIDSTSAHSK